MTTAGEVASSALHVLMMPSWYPRSATDVSGSFFREQAMALSRAGVRVGVVAPALMSLRSVLSKDDRAFRLEIEDDNGVATVRACGPNWLPRVPGAIRALSRRRGIVAFREYESRYGTPDVIHVQSMPDAGVVARALATERAIPYVVTEHTTTFLTARISRRERRLWSDVSARARSRFAVSEPFARAMESVLGPESGTWGVMPNLVERSFLELPLVGPSASTFTFVNVALLEPKKGHEFLLRAFADAFRGDGAVHLRIVGEGSQGGLLRRLAHSLGVANQVEFRGRLSRGRVRDAVASADVFVLPSLVETFGVAVIEALALGKPVVVTRCGGPESIVRPEEGWIVPPRDVAALASALRAAKSAARGMSGVKIRRACEERYGESAIVERMLAAYHTATE